MPRVPASPRELIVVAQPGAELRVTDKPVTSLADVDVKGLREILSGPAGASSRSSA